MEVVQNDPWMENAENIKQTAVQSFEDNFKPFTKLHDSADYISGLQNKLAKLKGEKSDAKSSDLVRGLESAKGQHMIHIIQDSNHLEAFDTAIDAEERNVIPDFLVRKLCPERQALAPEELLNLVLADELAKVVAGLREAVDSENANTEEQNSKSLPDV